MNYAMYTYNKKKLNKNENVRNVPKCRKYFGIVGLLCTITRYFEYRIWIMCIFCIWEHTLMILFNIFRNKKTSTISQKCEQFWDLGDFERFLVPLQKRLRHHLAPLALNPRSVALNMEIRRPRRVRLLEYSPNHH